MIDPAKYGTETEAANHVEIPRSTLQSAIDRGEVAHVKTCGGTRLVEIASAKRFAKNRPSRGSRARSF